MTYNRFIQGLHLAGVEVDRKILADLAVNDNGVRRAGRDRQGCPARGRQRASRGQGLRLTTPVVPLTSGNTRVKEARKLSRRSVRSERRLFLADGPKSVEAALASSTAASSRRSRRSRRPSCTPRGGTSPRPGPSSMTARWRPCPTRSPRPASSPSAASSTSPGRRWSRRDEVPSRDQASRGLVAICADVRDPGNAGTVIRTADAAGADAVVLAGSSVDAYNPKTVRASVGSLFHLPVVVEPDVAAAVAVRAAEPGLHRARRRRRRRDLPGTTPVTCWVGVRPGCSATRPGASCLRSRPSPTTASGSRSTVAPRASTSPPPPPSASTPPPPLTVPVELRVVMR